MSDRTYYIELSSCWINPKTTWVCNRFGMAANCLKAPPLKGEPWWESQPGAWFPTSRKEYEGFDFKWCGFFWSVFSSQAHCPQYPCFSPHSPVLWWFYDIYTRGPFYPQEGDVGAWQTCQSCWLCLWLECQTEPTVTDWGVVVVEGADFVSSKWLQENIEVGGVKANKKKRKEAIKSASRQKASEWSPDCLKTIDKKNMSERAWESWSDAAQSCNDVISWMWNT